MKLKYKPSILKIISTLVVIGVLFGILIFSLNENNIGNDMSPDNDYPVTVLGVKVTEAPQKIVVLSPFIEDILHTLNYEDIIVGRTEECTNSKISNIPSVGYQDNPDIKKIKSLQPDIVLNEASLSYEQMDLLEDEGIKILTFEKARDFAELGKLYTDIGSLLGGSNTGYKNAAICANSIYLSIQEINKLIPEDGNPISACYMYDTKGTVVTGDTLSSNLIEFSGANNIARDSTDYKMDINLIIKQNPQYIFCKPGISNQIKQDPNLLNIDAVKNLNVYEMDSKLIEAQDNKLIDAVIFMASIMYPELVT